MRKTTLHERSQIVALSEQGLSQSFIAGHMHLPRSTVGSILARFREDGEVLDCPRLGRPCLLGIRDERLAVRLLNGQKSGNAARLVVGYVLRVFA